MPCDNIAVQRLALTPDLVAELMGSREAREALRAKLEQAAGVGSSATITTYPLDDEAPTYVKITVLCRDGRTADAILYTQAYVAHGTRQVQVDGKMQFQGADRRLVAALTEILEPFADQVGVVAGREKMRKKVRELATVTEEVRTPSGAIIQRARI